MHELIANQSLPSSSRELECGQVNAVDGWPARELMPFSLGTNRIRYSGTQLDTVWVSLSNPKRLQIESSFAKNTGLILGMVPIVIHRHQPDVAFSRKKREIDQPIIPRRA